MPNSIAPEEKIKPESIVAYEPPALVPSDPKRSKKWVSYLPVARFHVVLIKFCVDPVETSGTLHARFLHYFHSGGNWSRSYAL